MPCRQEDHHHVSFGGDGEGEAVDKARLLARTQSAPLRPRGSMKGCSQSPTRQELQAFETLLDGTGAQMPDRSQLLATLSTSRYHSLLMWSLPIHTHLLFIMIVIISIISLYNAFSSFSSSSSSPSYHQLVKLFFFFINNIIFFFFIITTKQSWVMEFACDRRAKQQRVVFVSALL